MTLNFQIKFILVSMAINLSACAYTTKIGDKFLPNSEYNTLVVKADSAMQNGEWSKASVLYEKGFQLKPDAWLLKLKQATAYQNEGNLAQAFNTYQTIIDAKSSTSSVDEKVFKLAQNGQAKLGFKQEPVDIISHEKAKTHKVLGQALIDTHQSKVVMDEDIQKNLAPIPVQKITPEQLAIPEKNPEVQAPVIDQSKEVIAEVTAWAEAWASKKMDAYFSHYVDGFSGDKADANAWRKSRKTKILNSQPIKISFSDIKIRNNGVDFVDVFFTQAYQSGVYKDTGHKVLSLQKVNGHWLISQETFK